MDVALIGAGPDGPNPRAERGAPPRSCGCAMSSIATPALGRIWRAQTRRDVGTLGATPWAILRSKASSLPARPTCTLSTAWPCIGAAKRCCAKSRSIWISRKRKSGAAAKFEGARYVLGFNRRFDPHVTALREKIDRARSALETLTLINHDPAAPPPAFIPRSGGLFKDFTIHDLDLAYALLGEPPSQRFSRPRAAWSIPLIAAAGDVDTARVILRTASGKLCVISNTRRSGYGYDQRVEAYGSRGMAATGNERLDASRSGAKPARRIADPAEFPQSLHALLRARDGSFRRCVTGRAGPSVGYAEGLRRWPGPKRARNRRAPIPS
jgi:hypothetical protein